MSAPDIETLGEDVPLLEGMRTARAIRRLRTDPVPEALIRKVCEAGTFAPSGGNRQPWIFVAVTEAERRAWIAERYLARFRQYIGPAFERAEADPEFPEAQLRNMRAALHLAEHLHEAPVHLFVAGWKRRGQTQDQALFPAIQNILLACRALGLGAALTTMHQVFEEELMERFQIPVEYGVVVTMPIGYPMGRFGPASRRPAKESTYFDRWGNTAS